MYRLVPINEKIFIRGGSSATGVWLTLKAKNPRKYNEDYVTKALSLSLAPLANEGHYFMSIGLVEAYIKIAEHLYPSSLGGIPKYYTGD